MSKVLFHCHDKTGLIQDAVIKCHKHKNDDAVLLGRIKYSGNLDSKITPIFSKVIAYDFSVKSINFGISESQIEKNIVEYYDKLLSENGVSLEDFENIYTSCDMKNDFAIYMSIKRKRYNYIELYTNEFTSRRCNMYEYIIKNNKSTHGNSEYFKVAQKHRALCATSPLVDCVLRLDSSDDMTFLANHKQQKVNINKLLLTLSDEQKRILIDYFDDNNNIRDICAKANDAILLLTQRQWKFPITEVETGVMYQYLCDYFLEPNSMIAVKPHPSDIYNHKDFFNSSVVLPTLFPADLFPIVKDFTVKKAITISSGSIQKLDLWCNDLMPCGETFFVLWKNINQFYFTYKIIEALGKANESIYRNNLSRAGEAILNYMSEKFFALAFKPNKWTTMGRKLNGTAICGNIVFDKYLSKENYYNHLETFSKDELIIYLNLENNFNFIDYQHRDLLENIVTLEISKIPTKDKIFADIKSEYIYVYTTNLSHRNILKNICIEKQLPNVGFNLILKCIDNSKLYNDVLCKHIDMLTEKVDKYL